MSLIEGISACIHMRCDELLGRNYVSHTCLDPSLRGKVIFAVPRVSCVRTVQRGVSARGIHCRPLGVLSPNRLSCRDMSNVSIDGTN